MLDCETAAHLNHECWLAEFCPLDTVADLARNGVYICQRCGRVASRAENSPNRKRCSWQRLTIDKPSDAAEGV